VAPGVLSAGDQLNLVAWLGLTAVSGTTNTLRVYVSSSFTENTAATGTVVATYAVTGNNFSARFQREFSFITDTSVKSGIAPGTSSEDGASTTTADAATTIPSVSAGFWLVLAGRKAPSGTFKIERVALTGLFNYKNQSGAEGQTPTYLD
jgi:hypothetical protein